MAEEKSKRDLLFNAVLETVKENGKGMEIGLVRAVLEEVESEIVMCTGRQEIVAICDKLKRREPRERNQHSFVGMGVSENYFQNVEASQRKQTTSNGKKSVSTKIQPGMLVILNDR